MRKIKSDKDIKEVANELVNNYGKLLNKFRKRNTNSTAGN